MHLPCHNNRVVDLKKVQWAKFFYENQEGLRRSQYMQQPSVRGILIAEGYAYPYPDYPLETNLERATRLGILDIWEPVCLMQLQANRILHFTGDKAKKMWRAWNTRIYGSKK